MRGGGVSSHTHKQAHFLLPRLDPDMDLLLEARKILFPTPWALVERFASYVFSRLAPDEPLPVLDTGPAAA